MPRGKARNPYDVVLTDIDAKIKELQRARKAVEAVKSGDVPAVALPMAPAPVAEVPQGPGRKVADAGPPVDPSNPDSGEARYI